MIGATGYRNIREMRKEKFERGERLKKIMRERGEREKAEAKRKLAARGPVKPKGDVVEGQFTDMSKMKGGAQPAEPKFVGGEKFFSAMTGKNVVRSETGEVRGVVDEAGKPLESLEQFGPKETTRSLVTVGADIAGVAGAAGAGGLAAQLGRSKLYNDPVTKLLQLGKMTRGRGSRLIRARESELGITELGESGPLRVAQFRVNTKTLKRVESTLRKVFGTRTLLAAGGWASAVFLGLWGQAEAPEPVSIVMNKFLIPDAIKTGDWTVVDEASAIQNELTEISTWEKLGMMSPISPFIGIPKKIRGAAEGTRLYNKFIEDAKYQQSKGLSDEDMYAKARQDKFDKDKEIAELIDGLARERQVIDLDIARLKNEDYNAGRKKQLIWEEAFKSAAYRAGGGGMRAEKDLRAMRAEALEENEKFYARYHAMRLQIKQNTTLGNWSGLNFGLI